MSTTTPRILLLGGHGKVSLLMTPKILSRSWNLTSMVRNADHKQDILAAADKAPKEGRGQLDVLVESIEDVKSEGDAKGILETVKPDWVIWSAGAGGKGGSTRTYAIDQHACIHFIRASVSTPSITKFLLVSALSSRASRAPWWDEKSYELVQKINTEVMPHYYKAKVAADRALVKLGEERKGWGWISLRPGQLSDEEETGKVSLGRTAARGAVPRGDVAEVGVRLLEREGVSGWFDLLGGEEEVGKAVERVLSEGVDCREGEDLDSVKESDWA
ncbi:hypothetical protein CJF32_00000887 [Rutstroemia sp. NJR-2017a WRK4]|nr:hypothetical protein CJF32_00000887 [Rutstroemia sp. NJR-2017a WRK4]